MPEKTNFQKNLEFNQALGGHIGDFKNPKLPDMSIQLGYQDWIEEEFDELSEALAAQDLIETVDALTDIIYLAYGFLVALGVDGDASFTEVHNSNMTKLDEDGNPIRREDGKIVKGPNFKLPDLAGVLARQRQQ